MQEVVGAQDCNIKTPVSVAKPVQSEISKPIVTKTQFEILKDKIYERSYDVGKCFEENIEFISFEDGILKWVSYAQGDDKMTLHKASPMIKVLIYSIFGENTTIDFQKGEKKNDSLNEVSSEEMSVETPKEEETPEAQNTEEFGGGAS